MQELTRGCVNLPKELQAPSSSGGDSGQLYFNPARTRPAGRPGIYTSHPSLANFGPDLGCCGRGSGHSPPVTSRLPNNLQRKLNVPSRGLRHRGIQTSATGQRSVLIEQRGTTAVSKGQRRLKVGVIQDVEKLRPELHAEAL